jgi:hypothetical protein
MLGPGVEGERESLLGRAEVYEIGSVVRGEGVRMRNLEAWSSV